MSGHGQFFRHFGVCPWRLNDRVCLETDTPPLLERESFSVMPFIFMQMCVSYVVAFSEEKVFFFYPDGRRATLYAYDGQAGFPMLFFGYADGDTYHSSRHDFG